MAFPSLGNYHHVVSVSIDFPNSKRDASFHCIAYDDYPRADWNSLRDHLTDAPWLSIFKLGVSAAASEF